MSILDDEHPFTKQTQSSGTEELESKNPPEKETEGRKTQEVTKEQKSLESSQEGGSGPNYTRIVSAISAIDINQLDKKFAGY